MERQKRVAAIHDVSGFGKCALTVALPVISAAGIETAVIPTAVLSTHTGGFKGYTCLDLTDEMKKISAHWKSLGLEFDAIYSGYLASKDQVDIVADFIDSFRKENTFAVVDPAMADNGKMYALLDLDFAKEMKRLCEKADIMVPNITEACLLLGEEYKQGPYTEEYVGRLVRKLAMLNGGKVVLTGVSFDENSIGAACFDYNSGAVYYYLRDRVDGMFHGTGDVFASALTAALMRGKDLTDATRIAVDFTADSIMRTSFSGNDHRYGVDFENGLGEFIGMLEE
jgi:pyridoxine kinase